MYDKNLVGHRRCGGEANLRPNSYSKLRISAFPVVLSAPKNPQLVIRAKTSNPPKFCIFQSQFFTPHMLTDFLTEFMH
jgi:hypothetical protein